MRARPNGFTIIDLLLLNLILALIAVITVPAFIRFQSRSKQSEAKANLKALYTLELAYLQEKDVFTDKVARVGFEPERGNRYQYNLAAWSQDHLEDRSGTQVVSHFDDNGIARDTFKFFMPPAIGAVTARLPQVTAGPVDAHFIAGAVGWVDEGPTPDAWTISSRTQSAREGGVAILKGVPHNDEPCGSCTQ